MTRAEFTFTLTARGGGRELNPIVFSFLRESNEAKFEILFPSDRRVHIRYIGSRQLRVREEEFYYRLLTNIHTHTRHICRTRETRNVAKSSLDLINVVEIEVVNDRQHKKQGESEMAKARTVRQRRNVERGPVARKLQVSSGRYISVRHRHVVRRGGVEWKFVGKNPDEDEKHAREERGRRNNSPYINIHI